MTTALSSLPTATLTLILGHQIARRVTVGESGRVAALVAELDRRGDYEPLMASLPPDLAMRVHLMAVADRGQHWARSGKNPDSGSRRGPVADNTTARRGG